MRYRYRITEESDLCGSAYRIEIQSTSGSDEWSPEQQLAENTLEDAHRAAMDWIDRQVGWVEHP